MTTIKKKDSTIQYFEFEYNKIMKGNNIEKFSNNQTQIKLNGDNFVKFTLFVESPFIIATTNSNANNNF
jgi:hypothetical protein